jgi:hypothetical protein
VKSFMRGLTVLILCLGTLGVLGCGPDNDTEADRLAKTAGDPGKADPKGIPQTQEAPPKTQEEFAKRQRERTDDMFKKGGYPKR